jgi:hypothetical protein
MRRVLSRSVVVAPEKGWSLGASLRVTCAARRQSSVSERDSSHANQETGTAGEEWRIIHWALDAGTGARCYNRGYCEPGSASVSIHMGNVGLDSFEVFCTRSRKLENGEERMTEDENAQRIIDACEKHFEKGRHDCSGFLKSIVAELFNGEVLAGRAYEIAANISNGTKPWILIGIAKHFDAQVSANKGRFVVGATAEGDDGHVAVIAKGQLERDFPHGYAGSDSTRGDFSIRNASIRNTWSEKWRDKITYAYRELP